jgi:cytidylate kinase
MTTTLTIAIDGPAGSGKSSVSKEAARRLGYGYLDTGAAYRALAWHVLDAAADFPYAISLDPDDYWVRVADTDVTEAIREPRVSAAVSGVARVAAVRERVCARSAWLGIELDAAANAGDGRRIDRPGSQTAVWVLPTNEELVIARHTQRLVVAK